MRVVAAVLGLVFLVAACTNDPAPPPPSPTAAPHPTAPRAPDRDEAAVLDTLAGIDPCSLLSPPDDLDLLKPHACLDRHLQTHWVEVSFVARTSHAERYPLPATVIGGAKVDAIRTDDNVCQAEIPVSFRYAVQVYVRGPSDQDPPCDLVKSTAKTVIARLAKPGRHPADRPDLSKGACDVLAAALADTGDRTAKPTASGKRYLDQCMFEEPESGQWDFELLIGAGMRDMKKWATIGGKDVYVSADGCEWRWSEGAFDRDYQRLAGLSTRGCEPGKATPALTKPLIAALVKRLAEPQPQAKATKLTYAPGEADDPAPGACVDHESESCEPYQPTPIPAGAGPATRQASVDPHVACAAALDAVHGAYPDLKPVVDPAERVCSFVRPAHDLRLDITVRAPDPRETPVKQERLTIAGHPAEYREYEVGPRASVCLDSGQQGLFWCVTATYHAPRDHPDTKPTLADARRLVPITTAIATKYLRG